MRPSTRGGRPAASVIVPTRGRPGYLEVTLKSLADQVRRCGAELLVVDDGPDQRTRALADLHGAVYLAHPRPRGLNAARNTAIAAARSDLFVFVDDDIEAWPGWLAELLAGVSRQPDAGVFAGPIRARIEDHDHRFCGREAPPITSLDLGDEDAPADRAWGANMTVRRSAVELAGLFDEDHELYGDEQEFQRRHRCAGGSLHYIARAGVDHRRAGDDARLRSLARAEHRRGQASRRFDAAAGSAPGLGRELLTLAGCLSHAVRFRCSAGIVMAAHSAGRLRAACAPRRGPSTGHPEFLSGESGTVGGRRGRLRAAADRALDASMRATGTSRRLAGRAAAHTRRRVLIVGIERPQNAALMARACTELRRSRHETRIMTAAAGDRGKFANLNALLARVNPGAYDWMLVVDDDAELPPGFLDGFVYLAERHDLKIAQPAHRLHSHAAWRVTRRRVASVVRETGFVEIGPVTGFQRVTFDALLPFPDLEMGWGLDVHWSAIARENGWRMGVLDAVPVGHLAAPAGAAYDRAAAVTEAEAFLSRHDYVPAGKAARTLATHRRLPRR